MATDKSVLVVMVPNVEPAVDEFRRRFDNAPVDRLGAHITILSPFMPPEALSTQAVLCLRSVFQTHQRFTFTLARISRFSSALYFAPDPVVPFKALTRSVEALFPDFPPYAGAFAEPEPHLTIVQSPPAADLEAIRPVASATFDRILPVRCEADRVSLAIKRGGRWSVMEEFLLGESAAS